ncbi:MAG: AI-2E family transporter [Spirochaetales bacterium]|nr:AI-2E family transporter [Spirochaetales bacterium]
MKIKQIDRTRIDPALWIFILYLAAAIVLYKISPAITGSLILGLYLSMIIMVPAKYISKIKFIGEKLSLVISALLVFSILIFTVYQIFPIIIEQASKLLQTVSSADISINEIIEYMPAFVRDAIGSGVSTDSLSGQLSKLISAVSQYGMKYINQAIPKIPNIVTSIVIFVIAAAYLATLKPVVSRNLWRFFPSSTRKKSIQFVKNYYGSIKSFIGGQLIIAMIVGLIVGFGMLIAGIPYAMFLGFLAGVTNLIPFFGVIITTIPALFLGIVEYGLWGVVRVAVVLVIANQLESWVLSPKIQGDRMELNWFVILIGILLFGGLFGIVGVLFAVPIMVFIKEFWIAYVQDAFKRL